MLHRIRAHIAYPTGSGLAVWSRDQMQVRYGQAVHINESLANEEPPVNVVTDDDDVQVFRCDLPLMNEAAAATDALATLTTAAVWGQALPLPDVDGGPTPSWVEHHLCDHDEPEQTGCTVVTRVEADLPGPVEGWQPGVAYATSDEVVYDGTTYRCITGHTSQVGWEPPNVPALWQAL